MAGALCTGLTNGPSLELDAKNGMGCAFDQDASRAGPWPAM